MRQSRAEGSVSRIKSVPRCETPFARQNMNARRHLAAKRSKSEVSTQAQYRRISPDRQALTQRGWPVLPPAGSGIKTDVLNPAWVYAFGQIHQRLRIPHGIALCEQSRAPRTAPDQNSGPVAALCFAFNSARKPRYAQWRLIHALANKKHGFPA